MNDKEKIEDTQRQIDDLLETMQEVLDNTRLFRKNGIFVSIMKDLEKMKNLRRIMIRSWISKSF